MIPTMRQLRTITRQAPPDKEIGFSVCKFSGPGPVVTGDMDHVKIPLLCSGQNPVVYAYHTHPHGAPVPSSGDIAGARNLHVPEIRIGVPQTGVVKRYRIAP